MPEESVNPAAQEYYCRLTDAGAALEAAAHAEALPVLLTHVAVGDGGGEVNAPEASATALVNEVYRREIDGRERDKEDPNIAWLHIIIPADVGGFWIREFGVYAAPLTEGGAPVLYAVGNHAPYYKQQAGQGQATTHELSIPVILSGTAGVEISVRDAGYASQLALEDLRGTVEADRERLWENDGEGPKLLTAVLPDDALTESRVGRGLAMEAAGEDAPALLACVLATQEAPGIVQPDGATVTVDEDGLLRALGGNLLLNSELWITESGTFEAPVTGWYALLLFGGGQSGGVSTTYMQVGGGSAGSIKSALVRLEAGEEVPVTVGAGGVSPAVNGSASNGGATSFGDVTTAGEPTVRGMYSPAGMPTGANHYKAIGAGPGGGYPAQPSSANSQAQRNAACNASGHLGGGGAACLDKDKLYGIGAGAQGSVRVRWHDPAKAAGPLPAPALLSARRMARAAATPATVNLYDPETGQGSVWRAENAEAKLAEGLISEEAWKEICAARAAEARATWLASPESEAERFTLLRAARDARLAATDYLAAPDYPLTDEARAAVTAYRQALRDLPAQAGAPWDGGGEGTPWPEIELP